MTERCSVPISSLHPARGGQAVNEWIRAALVAASCDLANLPPLEAGSWLLRNWCEVVAILIATDNIQAVRHLHTYILAHYPAVACQRFALRLEGLMELAGLKLPTTTCDLVHHDSSNSSRSSNDQEILRLARALCNFADDLHEPASEPTPPQKIGPDELPALIAEAATLHGLGLVSAQPLPVDAEAPYLWRRWFRFPTSTGAYASFLLFPKENCSWDRATVWTGIHDAVHLLHLEVLPPKPGPASIEFNQGLILAESVAMIAEILAASAAKRRGQSGRKNFLWKGLAERLARVPQVAEILASERHRSPTASLVSELVDEEFVDLPTLALAYSAGPLRLAARGFVHDAIPASFSATLSSAWSSRAKSDPALAALAVELLQ